MLLALSIVSEQGAALGSTAYKVFDERGGTIGRITGNDWVLPDPQNFVSSRHALVKSAGGVFYLEDRSSNGTFINAPDQPASRGEPQALCDGDRLFIGDYEIIVQLIPGATSGLALGTVDPLAALGGMSAAAAIAPLPPGATLSGAPSTHIETPHHRAMMAAARAAFTAMLSKLHPDNLDRAQFEQIHRNRDACFQELFGETFTRAYDEQLRKSR